MITFSVKHEDYDELIALARQHFKVRADKNIDHHREEYSWDFEPGKRFYLGLNHIDRYPVVSLINMEADD